MGDKGLYDRDSMVEEDGSERSDSFSFLRSILPRILKWVALILVGVIFIVTVVFFSIRIMNRGDSGITNAVSSEVLVAKTPTYSWFAIEEIRSRTADSPPATAIVRVKLGYQENDREIQSELVKRQDQIFDLIRSYFSRKNKSELTPQAEGTIKQELRERINRLLTNRNAVKEVIFMEYNLYEF